MSRKYTMSEKVKNKPFFSLKWRHLTPEDYNIVFRGSVGEIKQGGSTFKKMWNDDIDTEK